MQGKPGELAIRHFRRATSGDEERDFGVSPGAAVGDLNAVDTTRDPPSDACISGLPDSRSEGPSLWGFGFQRAEVVRDKSN